VHLKKQRKAHLPNKMEKKEEYPQQKEKNGK